MLGHTVRKIMGNLIFFLIANIAAAGYGMGLAHGICAGGILLIHDFETGTTDNWVG